MKEPYYLGQPARIGNETQLLIDDHMVEDRWRLRREVFVPEKYIGNPVLIRNKPWEGDYLNVPMVIHDPEFGKYRMWYGGIYNSEYLHRDVRRKFVLYAESDDGVHWEKPLLDVCPVDGFDRTNVVYQGTHLGDPARYGAVCDQVIRDEAEPDPQRRYKMISYEARPDGDGYRRGLNLLVSPDGLRWTMTGDRFILDYQSDTSNNMAYDPATGHWLLYVRPRYLHSSGLTPHEPTPGFHPEGRHHSRRVAVMASPDLENWSYPRTCFYPDERDAPDYDATTVFRCGSHFIMLYTAMDDDVDGEKDVKVASSPDGFHWFRPPAREPYIGRGGKGEWDAAQIMRISSAPPVRQGNKQFVYYLGATKGQHDWHGQTGFGIAMSEPDRYVMQTAGDEPAWLITREFLLEGNRLRLNTFYRKTKVHEHFLRAEIARRPELGGHGGFRTAFDGFSLADCDPVQENGTEALVTWNGSPDLSALQGKPVYLRFELRNMGIFSFRVTEE